MSAIQTAKEQIKTDEGLQLKPYLCTAGALTIGYGRNLDAVGITLEEADAMLEADVSVAAKDAQALMGATWDQLTDARQAVLINMSFNLGRTRLATFTKFLTALKSAQYDTASLEMLDSRWARQVGARADRLAETMRLGQ